MARVQAPDPAARRLRIARHDDGRDASHRAGAAAAPASFLACQRTREKGQDRSNGQTLFGVGRIPFDYCIRDGLEEADPALLQPCFERPETLPSEPAMRQAFGRLAGRTLIAWDRTQYFCSQKLGCPDCLTRERSKGKTENHHCLLSASVEAPGHSEVVTCGRTPRVRLEMPEFVATQNGSRKTGLRTRCRQTLVRQALRAARGVAPDLSGRRSVRLSPRRRDGRGRGRRFLLHLQAGLAPGIRRSYVHHGRPAAVQVTRAQSGREHLAIHARELALQPDLRQL